MQKRTRESPWFRLPFGWRLTRSVPVAGLEGGAIRLPCTVSAVEEVGGGLETIRLSGYVHVLDEGHALVCIQVSELERKRTRRRLRAKSKHEEKDI